MEILAIIPYSPTLIRTRSYNLLLTLVKRGHKITLATLWENKTDLQSLSVLNNAGIEVIAVPLSNWRKLQNIASGIFSREPVQAHFSRSLDLIRELEKRYSTRKPDMVHVEHLRGSYYAEWALKFFHGECPVIWDAVDCISLLFERMIQYGRGGVVKRLIAQFELNRTRRLEGLLVNTCNQTVVVGLDDLLRLGELFDIAHSHYNYKSSPIKILQNGTNLKHFIPSVINTTVVPPKIVFSGKMSYHANESAALWLIKEIMPIVWRERPDVLVQLVGASPKRVLQILAKRDPQHILCTGYVDNIVPYLQNCTLAVAPIIYGTGIQNKVLEAMACGTPVIATPQAVSALKVEADKDVLVANDAHSFAMAMLRTINDPLLREQISTRGRQYVQNNHDWEQIAQEYELIIKPIINLAI